MSGIDLGGHGRTVSWVGRGGRYHSRHEREPEHDDDEGEADVEELRARALGAFAQRLRVVGIARVAQGRPLLIPATVVRRREQRRGRRSV